MGQLGFFDANNRLTALSAKGDPLEAIDRLVPWESLRSDIEAAVLTPETERKSTAGRKPIDAMVLFRMRILQSLYNLSDEQVEYQLRDRLSFTRFLTSGIEDCIPDGTTLWLFREKLAKAGVIKELFDRFDQHLGAKGYIARGGQGPRLPQPHPRARDAPSSALAAAGGSEPEEEPGSSSHRACVRSSGDLRRQPARTDDRHRQSASEDRITEPCVQRPPPRDAGADGYGLRAESAYAACNGAL